MIVLKQGGTMAQISLSGWFTLDAATVDARVGQNQYGCYALGGPVTSGNKMLILRVGRSDDNLASRIKAYIGDRQFADCKNFGFQVVTSVKEAFELECALFHTYSPTKNVNHPARPNGTNYRCPNCGA